MLLNIHANSIKRFSFMRFLNATCNIDIFSLLTELIIPLINDTVFGLFENFVEIIIKSIFNVREVVV